MCLQHCLCTNSTVGANPTCTTFRIPDPNGSPFRRYDPKSLTSADEQFLHTHTEFVSVPRKGPAFNHGSCWALCLPLPRPAENITLRRVEYTISYATMHDMDSAVVQTEVVIKPWPGRTSYYFVDRESGQGRLPYMDFDGGALCFSATLAVKPGGVGETRGRYVDHRVLEPDIHIDAGTDATIYVVFSVEENPTAGTQRELIVRALAIWQKEEVENHVCEAAKAAAEKEADEKEKERLRLEEERQERLDAKAWRDGETAARIARENPELQAGIEREQSSHAEES
ncbi:hypothetical protein HYPSUDRAFT_57856 [Hypholoma sublateritium FD-334 SS-4]|uniref:Uncharacterized protein n=1 Tax=Hypholoma sublateritium (strain FD-334 SS-4) TaxID=945553 RepID=A0A0D2NKS1_HYPSF|nr:hypothetical protein HYPSUDRAFT_57856 [Hypholoma sublateritium FD-334 SS-4]